MSEPVTKEYLDEKFDKFADTVQRGFQDVREQQNALRTDLVAVMDTKLTVLRTDLVGVMDTKLDLLGDRLTATLEQRLAEKTSEVITHVDAFASLHKKLDQELTALRGKYDRLEGALQKIAQHLHLDLQQLF